MKEIKGDARLRKIPLILLVSPKIGAHKDSWLRSGVESLIIKPRSLEEMIREINGLHEYHFAIVGLPNQEDEKGLEMERIGIPERGYAGLGSIAQHSAYHHLM